MNKMNCLWTVFFGTAFLSFAAPLLAQQSGPQEQKKSEAATETQAAGGPKSLKEKASYLAGYQFMSNALRSGIEFDLKQLLAGIRQAAEGKELGMDREEVDAVNLAFRREVMKKQKEKMERLAAKNLLEGKTFVENYAKKENAKGPLDGIYYRVLKPGDGPKPKSTDRVKVHFSGKSIQGDTLLSTIGRDPANLAVATQIKGFVTVIQKMKTGGKWEVVIPPEQAFGKRGSRVVGPNQTVVYEIELLEIVQPPKKEGGTEGNGD